MNLRVPRALLLLLPALATGPGCAGARRVPVSTAVGPAGCRDVSLRARYTDSEGERSPTIKVRLRECSQGVLSFELRGKVGGVALAGAAEGGRLVLLFPRDRISVVGPDEAAVWKQWVGLPLSGRLLRELLARPENVTVGDWRIRRDEADPRRFRALAESGGRLDLWSVVIKPAPGGAHWPEAPDGFEIVRVTAAEPAGSSGQRPAGQGR